jgi:hypothetical protein
MLIYNLILKGTGRAVIFTLSTIIAIRITFKTLKPFLKSLFWAGFNTLKIFKKTTIFKKFIVLKFFFT